MNKQHIGGFSKNCSHQLKGLASIFIVVHHFLHLTVREHNIFTYIISAHFGYIFVSLFFLLSAYGLSESESHKPTKFSDFIKKRVLKVYKPFVIVNLLTIALYGISKHETFTFVEVIQYSSGLLLIDPFLWYILMSIILYFLFWFSFQFKIKVNKIFILSASCLVLMLISGLVLKLSDNIYVSILSFPIGLACSLFKRDINPYVAGPKFYLIYAVYVFLVLAIFLGLHKLQLQILKTIIMSILLVPLFLRIASTSLFESRLFNLLGDVSFEIYLIHMKVFVGMGIYLLQFRNLFIYLIVVVIAAYALKHLLNFIDHLNFQRIKSQFS